MFLSSETLKLIRSKVLLRSLKSKNNFFQMSSSDQSMAQRSDLRHLGDERMDSAEKMERNHEPDTKKE